LERPRKRLIDLRFGTRNAKNLYKAGLLATVSRYIAQFKLELVAVQKV
jgi:hypothetical protein